MGCTNDWTVSRWAGCTELGMAVDDMGVDDHKQCDVLDHLLFLTRD